MSEKLNQAFDVPLEYIEDTINARVNSYLTGYERVISPRDLTTIEHLSFMRKEILEGLLRHVPLRDETKKVYPYENSDIEDLEIGPKGCYIGQRFVLESKVLSLMRAFGTDLFEDFCTSGLSSMPPTQLYGKDSEGQKALAFYVPPIVEMHDNKTVLIDGIHRNYICRSAGTTINAIKISHIGAPLPFKPINWKDCPFVSEKPPKEERYIDLDIKRFRDLRIMGIDG